MKTSAPDAPTKQKLLAAAERLMLAQGYAATTVDDICGAARLTKGSFFHYFASKEALGRELLERFCRTAQRRMREAPCCGQADPLRRVLGHIDFAMEQMGRQQRAGQVCGCLLGTFAQELSDTHPGIRAVCAEAFSQWAGAFKKDVDAAKARYAPRATWETKGLAEHFVAVIEGALLMAKAQQDPKVLERSLRHFRRYVESLFVR